MSTSLICSMPESMLQQYAAQQLSTFFPDNDTTIEEELSEVFSDAMQR